VALGLAVLSAGAGCGPKIIIEEPSDAPEDGHPGTATATTEDHRVLVQAAASAYADALAKRDAPTAATWVVPETFTLYEELRSAALHADRETLEQRSLLTVVMILEMRVRLSPEALEALDGRALFEHAVAEGLTGEGLERIDLSEVWVGEGPERGRAEIRVDGQTLLTLARSGHERHDDPPARWLVDVPELLRRLAPTFEQLASERVEVTSKFETARNFLSLRMDEEPDLAALEAPRP